MRTVTPEMKARSDARLAQAAKGNMKGSVGGQFGADNNAAKADAEIRKLRAKRQAERAKPETSKPKPITEKPAAPKKPNVGKKAVKQLTRPAGEAVKAGGKAVVSGGLKTASTLGKVAKVAGRIGLPGALLQGGMTAIDMASDHYNGKLDDLQNRMLSDDPEVSAAAVAEWQAQNAPQRPGTSPEPVVAADPAAPAPEAPKGTTPQNTAPAPTDAAAEQPVPVERPYTGETERAVDSHIGANSAVAGPDINAGNLQPIEGTDASYAGKYGDNEVIQRPTIGKDGQPVIDPGTGQAVPELTDNYTAFNKMRPGGARTAAEEEARGEQARADYIRNTTGSDGRRYFGGSATERLRGMQMDAAKRGDPDGTVANQLFEEGLTPEQRLAYQQDAAGQMASEATTKKGAAAAQLAAFKEQYNRNRHTRQDKRQARADSMRVLTDLLQPYKDSAPEAYQQLYMMGAQEWEKTGGNMTDVYSKITSQLDMESGYPEVEGGKLKRKLPEVSEAMEQTKEVDTFF